MSTTHRSVPPARIEQAGLVLLFAGLVWAWWREPPVAGAAEPRYLAWLMTQGVVPFKAVFSTVSPSEIWLQFAVGAPTGFHDVALVGMLALMLAPLVWSGLRRRRAWWGTIAVILVVSMVPWRLLTNSNLIAGFALLGMMRSAARVSGAAAHWSGSLWALLAGVLGGVAVSIVPWLLGLVWALQIGWTLRIHAELKPTGWHGVSRTLYASLASLLGLVLVVSIVGGWLVFLDAWAGLQRAVEARQIVGFALPWEPPNVVLALALVAVLFGGVLRPGDRRVRVGAALTVVVSLAVSYTAGDGSTLLLGVPSVAILWADGTEAPYSSWPLTAAAWALTAAAVVWAHFGALPAGQEAIGPDSPAARSLVIERMRAIEGASVGAVLTNHREHALLMQARRLPGTPFLDGALVSEAQSDETIRRLALNRVDQAHHGSPRWVVWNLAAARETESLEANPTLAVWIRSNCVLAIPDVPGALAPYDLFYCGVDRNKVR